MNKKVLVIGVSIIIGGITAKVVKNFVDRRKELIEGVIENNEI